MKTFIAGLLIITLPLSARAETGFFSSKTPLPETDSDAVQSAERLFKIAPGCNLTLEIGDHHTRVTDSKGNSQLFTYFDDGRLARVTSAHSDVSIIYETNSAIPVGAVDSVSGKTRAITRQGKGPDFYRALMAAGQLPSPEKLVSRVCSANKAAVPLDDSLEQEYMDPDFWVADMTMDFDLSTFGLDAIDGCDAKKAACHAQCERAFNNRAASCLLQTGLWSEIATPLVGVIIGAICGWVSGNQQATCHANCEAIC